MSRLDHQRPTSAAVINRVHHYRTAKGLSTRALAEATTAAGYPVGRTTIASHEAASCRSMSVDLVVGLAAGLGMPVVYLLSDGLCLVCRDAPPVGFTCNGCGLTAPLVTTARPAPALTTA